MPKEPVEEILNRSYIALTATKQTRQKQSPKYTYTPWVLEACILAVWTFNKLYTVTNQVYLFLQSLITWEGLGKMICSKSTRVGLPGGPPVTRTVRPGAPWLVSRMNSLSLIPLASY